MVHEELLYFFIGGVLPDHPVSGEDPFGIGIHHKKRFPSRVEEDAIHALGTESINSQELRSELERVLAKKPADVSSVTMLEMAEEGPQPFRLDIESAGGTDLFSKTPLGKFQQASDGQGA